MTVRDQSIVVCLLNELLASARKIAEEPELPVDQICRLVEECWTHFRQVKAIMEASQNVDARDGARVLEDHKDFESKENISSLVIQANERLLQGLRQLSDRKKIIAEELEQVRRTQQATRAYYGLKPTSKQPRHH